ncbi:MAG: phage tail protein [Acidobacteriota bacterium]
MTFGVASAPVGAIVAYAGQLQPVSSSVAEGWDGECGSCGPDSPSPPPVPSSDDPLALIEAQGWLVCDGRTLEVARYPALYGVLGTLYGSAGAGTFRVPDYRGLFLRGVDHGAGMDPDSTGRCAPPGGSAGGVGSRQCDAMQDHVHAYMAAPTPNASGTSGSSATAPAQPTATGPPAEPGSVSIANPQGTPVPVSSETRPVNVSVHYLIRFR